MRPAVAITTLAIVLVAVSAAQESKPRVFVKGHGTINSTTQSGGARDNTVFGHRSDSIVDSHDESIELTKDLREECPDIIVTLKEDAADFLVMLNRESKMKKGLGSKNNQVMVANKDGDVIWTKDVRQVKSAAKDVCAAVLATRDTKPSAAISATPASKTASEAPPRPLTASNLASPPVPAAQSKPGLPANLGITFTASPGKAGAEITKIESNSVVYSSGLHPGDIVTMVDEKAIRTPEELMAQLSTKRPGSKVRIGYLIHGMWQSEVAINIPGE